MLTHKPNAHGLTLCQVTVQAHLTWIFPFGGGFFELLNLLVQFLPNFLLTTFFPVAGRVV
jgi:hypothetical protein